MIYKCENENIENRGFYNYEELFENNVYTTSDLTIYRIGDIYLNKTDKTDSMFQDHDEIVFVISGSCIHRIDEKDFLLTRYDVLIIPKGCQHSVRGNISESRFVYIDYEPSKDSISSLHEIIPHKSATYIRRVGEIEYCLKGIFTELTYLKSNSRDMIDCYIKILFLLVSRKEHECVNEYDNTNMTERQKLTFDIKLYLNRNFLSISSLSDIGKVFKYSYTHLSHVFSEETGMSISNYYNRLRFKYASEQLLAGAMSISQLSSALNYSSEQSFSKAFKEYFGISPQNYLRLSH